MNDHRFLQVIVPKHSSGGLVNHFLVGLSLAEAWAFNFTRLTLGIVYFVLAGTVFYYIFIDGLVSRDFALTYPVLTSFYLLVVAALFFLSYGFFAKKHWVVTLYWTCCGFWSIAQLVVIFSASNFLSKLTDPVWVFEACIFFWGPMILGLFIWRHRDQFSTGILPLSWQQVSRDKEAAEYENPH